MNKMDKIQVVAGRCGTGRGVGGWGGGGEGRTIWIGARKGTHPGWPPYSHKPKAEAQMGFQGGILAT